MKNKIRWGVIGSCGIARRRTIPEGLACAANAEMVAVYDPNTDANRAVGRDFRAQPVESVEELLRGDIDAVYIASPPAAHPGQVAACAQAGKHVLCEKPLALTVPEAEAMAASCRQAGVLFGVGLMMRFVGQHQAALRMIRDGELGRPVFARAQLSCWYPPIPGAWRQDPAQGGGGSLMDMGGHCLDLLEMLFGEVRTVTCVLGQTVHDYAVEDSALVSLKFANGALGMVDTFFCMPDTASQNRLELYGTSGSLLAHGTIGQGAGGEMLALLDAEAKGYDAAQARGEAAGRSINPPAMSPYRAEIEEFSQAILEGREPVNHAGLGLQNQRMIAACYESAATGRAVSLAPA
jgi:predicted dehydrogenase